MVQLFIDKQNKVPLYLQLKDQLKYYISTGSIRAREQLPPVKALAKSLGINFLTVRKAYRELENEGLVNIKHGEGTFISINNAGRPDLNSQNWQDQKLSPRNQLASAIKNAVNQSMSQGLELATAKGIIGETIEEIERNLKAPIVVFTECNLFQIKEISELLQKEFELEVKPMLVADLKNNLPPLVVDGSEVNVITTGFHVNEVRNSIADLPVQIDVLITNLSPETRRQLEAIGEEGNYSFICRDKESAMLYKELLKAELGFKQMHLTCCTIAESEKVQAVLNSSDVVLASPPVFEDVRKLAAPGKSVYNVFERVDPMSLRVVKDRILGNAKSLYSFL